jgi:hypothetical protein
MAKKPRKFHQAAPPAQEEFDPKPRRQWHAMRWEFIAAALSMVVIGWMVTDAGRNIFPSGGVLEGFYDAQADSLLHGRIDVPPESIGYEAFIHDGKSYGYFGPTPALPRLLLNVLIPGSARHWNRISMLLASLLVVCMLLVLLRRLEELLPPEIHARRMREWLGAALIIAAVIGSSNFPVAAEMKAYQEALAWASALSVASAVCLVSYLMQPSRKWLVLSCSTAFFAFFARASSGAGPVFALFVLDLLLLLPAPRLRSFFAVAGLPSPREAIVAFSITLAATAALWGGLNYWKFGNVLTSVPATMHISYKGGPESPDKLFSLANVPFTLWAYTSPSNLRILPRFPWVDYAKPERSAVAARFPHSQVARVERFASLSAVMPELLMAALAGTLLCFGRRRRELAPVRAPLIGALAGCGLVLTVCMITYRYLHDVFPWLILGSAIAIACIPSITSRRMRYAVASLFMIGAAYSTCVNFWFGVLQNQYYAVPTLPEKRFAFLDFGADIDRGGWHGLMFDLTHWRGYIPAKALQARNLVADLKFAGRPDEPIARSSGPAPHVAEYGIDLPAAGTYHLSIRYASPDSRPVRLFLNGNEVNQACALPTGGASAGYQTWSTAGVFRLPEGRVRVGLLSAGEFPNLSMLRFVLLD